MQRIRISLVCILAFFSFNFLIANENAERNFRFINGKWFNGSQFIARDFYSVAGVFATKAPDHVDEVIDLKEGYVIPPFADAHNHYIAGPHDIDKILAQYLKNGIFYAKNPASIARDTNLIRDKINRPDSVDVVFANAGITATGGHPVKLYEQFLSKVKKPGPDGTFNDLGYYIIDDQKDLEEKWPKIFSEHPDFIKVHLLYSEDFEKRRDDPAFYGDKGLDPKLLPLIVAKAHENHLRVSCHIETAEDFRNALRAGIDEINHLPGYYPDFRYPGRFEITEKDAALAASKKVFVVTTTYVSKAEMKDPQELQKAREIQKHNLKMLHQAGVRIAIGPDVYGVTSLEEAMNLYDLGVFDTLTLLKLWCENTPATIFPQRKIGMLREGYEASFLVLGGNPLENFENVKDIRMRCKQGRLL